MELSINEWIKFQWDKSDPVENIGPFVRGYGIITDAYITEENDDLVRNSILPEMDDHYVINRFRS